MCLCAGTTRTEQFQIPSYCVKSRRKSQDGGQSAFATGIATCAQALARELQQAGAQSDHLPGALALSNALAHSQGNSLAFTQNTEVTTAFVHALAKEPELAPADGLVRTPDAPDQVLLSPVRPQELELTDDTADFVDIPTCPKCDSRANRRLPRGQGNSYGPQGTPPIQSVPRTRPWSGVAILRR